jgi:hypothetical protein
MTKTRGGRPDRNCWNRTYRHAGCQALVTTAPSDSDSSAECSPGRGFPASGLFVTVCGIGLSSPESIYGGQTAFSV